MISLRTKQKQSQLNQIRKQDVLNFLEKTHDIFKIPKTKLVNKTIRDSQSINRSNGVGISNIN